MPISQNLNEDRCCSKDWTRFYSKSCGYQRNICCGRFGTWAWPWSISVVRAWSRHR